jgi:hypothetical protein
MLLIEQRLKLAYKPLLYSLFLLLKKSIIRCKKCYSHQEGCLKNCYCLFIWLLLYSVLGTALNFCQKWSEFNHVCTADGFHVAYRKTTGCASGMEKNNEEQILVPARSARDLVLYRIQISSDVGHHHCFSGLFTVSGSTSKPLGWI